MAAKKPDIWMPLYVADYQADTAYLTTEQHGAYLLMLMAYWRNGPIPDNDGIIASITRQTPDAWRSTRAMLEAFFQVSDGVWFHKRVEAEYDRARRNRQTAHDRAVKAAKARWDAQEMLQALPEAMHEGMLERCPSPSPSTSQSKAQSQEQKSPVADAPAPKKRPTGKSQSLTDWLTDCKAKGQKPIADDDTIRQWATEAGIPDEYMRLAWLVFTRDWKDKKHQKNWPATFRDAIRRNWLKLWYFDNQSGECRLTTAGEQERRNHG